jgi:hypothetical protein
MLKQRTKKPIIMKTYYIRQVNQTINHEKEEGYFRERQAHSGF